MNTEHPRSGAQPGKESTSSASDGPPGTSAPQEAANAGNVASGEAFKGRWVTCDVNGQPHEFVAPYGSGLGGCQGVIQLVPNPNCVADPPCDGPCLCGTAVEAAPPGPRTEFTADECMALLDLLDRASRSSHRENIPENFVSTAEEQDVLAKLREAGQFYVPVEPVSLPPVTVEPRAEFVTGMNEAIRTRVADQWSGFVLAAVSDSFGLGSTYSIELCRNFDLDPDEKIGGAR